MDEKLKQVEQILKKYGQEQLLQGYNRQPGEKEKEEFLNDLLTIDFAQIEKLYEASKKAKDFSESKIEPINFVDKSKLSKEEKEELEDEARQNAIPENSYADLQTQIDNLAERITVLKNKLASTGTGSEEPTEEEYPEYV